MPQVTNIGFMLYSILKIFHHSVAFYYKLEIKPYGFESRIQDVCS